MTVTGSVPFGTFNYKWESANDFYNEAPPAARLVDGAVIWNLKPVGTLLDKVTYRLLFDCHPTQYTYDLIAELMNGTKDYSVTDPDDPRYVDPVIRQYLVKLEDGTYGLKTNTTAWLDWENSLTHTAGSTIYTNPQPVSATAESMEIEKFWIGNYNEEEKQEKMIGIK